MDITRQSYGHNQYLNCRGGLSTRVSASPSRFSVSLKRIQRSTLKLAVSTIKTQTPAEDNPTLRWRPFSFCFLFGLHFDLGAKTFFQSCSEHLLFFFLGLHSNLKAKGAPKEQNLEFFQNLHQISPAFRMFLVTATHSSFHAIFYSFKCRS